MFHAIITCTPLLPFRCIIPRHSPRFCYYPTTAALTNDNELCDLQSQQLGRDFFIFLCGGGAVLPKRLNNSVKKEE